MEKPSIKEEKKLLRQQRQEKEKKKNFLLIIVFSIIIVFIIYLCINPIVSLSYTNEANTKYKYYIQGDIVVGYVSNYCRQTKDKDIKCKDENLFKASLLTNEEKEIIKAINLEIKNNNNLYLESETCKALSYVLKKNQVISEEGNADWDLYNSYDTNKDKKTTYLEYGDEYLRSIYNGI